MSEFYNTPRLVLLPAVDVAGGKAVRLTKGEAGTETNYGDPVDAAADWADQGAEWIHLVDLDAAFGRGSNAGVLKKVIRQVRGVSVELSGGIRDDASLEHALEIGAKRINLGTAALENPEWAASRDRPVRRGGRGRPRRPRHDPRGARLDPGRRRPLAGHGPPRGGGRRPVRRHRRHQGRHAAGAEPRPPPPGHGSHRTARSSPRAASRASTTSSRSASSCRSASRARSSARPCTPARSRWPRRWMSPDTEPDREQADAPPTRRGEATAAADSAGVPWAGRSFEPNAHAADDGRAPEELMAALGRFRVG